MKKTLIKEIPEYLDTREGVFKNIPVSGIVIESIDFPDFDFDEGPLSSFGVKIYDPRGFRLRISYSNLCEIMKHATIVNGTIEEELYYARPSERRENGMFFPFCGFPGEESFFDWCLVSKDKEINKTVNSTSLVPGNRYLRERPLEFGHRREKKNKEDILVYLGTFEINNVPYKSKTHLFVDVKEECIIEESIHSRSLWTLISEQHPADLDLMGMAINKFKESAFGDYAELEKLIPSSKVIDDTFEVKSFIESSKHTTKTKCFIKLVGDLDLRVMKIVSEERRDRRRNYWYYVHESRYYINKHGRLISDCSYAHHMIQKDLIKFCSELEGYRCVSLNDKSEHDLSWIKESEFFDCVDSRGNIIESSIMMETGGGVKIKL